MPRKEDLMNKYTKGAIATGAAIVLLLGGAGTFALWNDDADVAGGSISSGTLTIAPSGTGEWTDADGDVVDIDSYLIVPGDVLTFTQDVVIAATGTNLEATLDYAASSIVAPLGPQAAANAALKTNLVVTISSDAAGNLEITPADDGNTVEVTVTVELPDSVAGTTAQGGTVDLSHLLITLTQHLPAP
jgi:alternate signal-mediated exported protein